VLGSICAFNSSSGCFMKLDTSKLDTCKLTIVISSLYVVPFISMKWPPSLSLLTNLIMKSTLSDVSVAIPTWFQGNFLENLFPPFYVSQGLFLSVRQVSWKQHIIGSSFLIQIANGNLDFDGVLEIMNTQCQYWEVCGNSSHFLAFCVCVCLILDYTTIDCLLISWGIIILILSWHC
jgi:hypothetical protein